MSYPAKSKANRTGRNEVATEHFTKMIRNTMQTPAWRALSSTAQALYPWLKLEWRGANTNNNGKIRLSVRQAGKCLGVSANTAANALHDLQAKGFIVVREAARLGIEGAAKCPAYEITEIVMPGHDRPRKLYVDWSKGGDFPVPKPMANNPRGRNGRKKACHQNCDRTVSKTETNDASPVSIIETRRLKNDDEIASEWSACVSKTETSLIYQTFGDAERAPPATGQARVSARSDADARLTTLMNETRGWEMVSALPATAWDEAVVRETEKPSSGVRWILEQAGMARSEQERAAATLCAAAVPEGSW